jgi:hypothetical protein
MNGAAERLSNSTQSGRPFMNKLQRIIAILLASGGLVAGSQAATNLYTPAPSYAMTNHTVSTSFFHWYTSTGGQVSGPWLPLEGRPAWTGTTEWWKGQIKQTMMANIDIFYVHLIPNAMEQQRINLFEALNQLRSEGYDVPKVAPFLDPIITWDILPGDNNMNTTAGKDKFVDQYIRFFNQYYSVNQDAYADDYIAKYDGRVILDSWHPHTVLSNVPALTREDVMTRLQAAFGTNSIFSNDIYMVTTVGSVPNYIFADEKVRQFEVHDYFSANLYNGIKTTQVKPGYWDQNVRNPGYLLPRDGGIHYTAAWDSVAADSDLTRVYIESFNEYDEGSGIYAGDPTNSPWIKPGSGNTGTDTWSSTDDPYEYLKTTATGAAVFNDTPNHDAKILWHDFPAHMLPGSTQQVSVVVRNTGDASWTAAADYKFGDKADNEAVFGLTRYLIDDLADEIPVYGGIFRGRPKTFELTLIAPTTPGTYEVIWSMLQENVEWFGEELVQMIDVGDPLAFTFDMEPAASNTYILSWTASTGLVYSIDWTADLTNGFIPLASNIPWPQSSYTDTIHQAETEGFYRMHVDLDTGANAPVTNATITTGIAAYGVGTDLFQGATVTGHSPMYPAGFLAEDMFSHGAELNSVDAIFADTAAASDYVEFNIPSAVNLGSIVIGLINDNIAGAGNDNRAASQLRVYASDAAETVLDNLIADIAIDPEYTTAYGQSSISVSIDLDVQNARYFRAEFTRSNPNSGPRVMEIDGYAAP